MPPSTTMLRLQSPSARPSLVPAPFDDEIPDVHALDQIGETLRAYHEALLKEPMPDRIANLLDRLARGERR